MKEIAEFLKGLPPATSIVALFLVIILTIFVKWESIVKFIKWIKGDSAKNKRTCGDCVLILFGIREKYEFERRQIDTNLLRLQMKFAEQKIQEVIFFLSQSFSEDIELLGSDSTNSQRITETALYCEAMKNSLLATKDEIRRSFKENGFGKFSESEYTHYVKEKTSVLITTIRSYLRQHYVETDKTIVKLHDRFKKMDEKYYQKFESWVFEIFGNARDLNKDAYTKKRDLEQKFRNDIDKFVNEGRTSKIGC